MGRRVCHSGGTPAETAWLPDPDDISLVTQGMEYMTEFLAPPQTAVMQDFELLAQKSVEMLWELMRRRTVSEDILIPAKLIIRESTAPPPGK